MPYSAITMKSNGWQKEENWTTFLDARRVAKECGFKGLGFVFKFPYVGIDLDDCIEEDGMMNDFARDITKQFDTFIEYSLSGKGLHIYCKVDKPIKPVKTSTIEVYGEGRFFVVTGKALDETQDYVNNHTEQVNSIIAKYQPQYTQKQVMANEVFVEGERNNRMTSEVGRMLRFWDKATVYKMANQLNQCICKPPLTDKEMDMIIDSVSKRDISKVDPKPMKYVDWEHVEGKRDLDKTPYKGISKRSGKYIPTGIPSIDYAINDLAPCCVTLIAGRSNCGKSTFVKQIIANTINNRNKVFLISGEGEQEIFVNQLYECIIGRNPKFYNTTKVNQRWHKEPTKQVLDLLQVWHKNKLVLFSKADSKFKTTDELFQMMRVEATTNKPDLIIIDNLMSILTAKAVEKNEAQADFMQQCHDLAIKNHIHIIIVLHPNKEFRKGMEFDMEMISGTSDLYNKADNIIAVTREYDQAKINEGINGSIALLKNRYYPELLTVPTHFEVETGLILEIKDGNTISYGFDWGQDTILNEKEWWEFDEG